MSITAHLSSRGTANLPDLFKRRCGGRRTSNITVVSCVSWPCARQDRVLRGGDHCNGVRLWVVRCEGTVHLSAADTDGHLRRLVRYQLVVSRRTGARRL